MNLFGPQTMSAASATNIMYSNYRNYAPLLDVKGGIITEKVFPVFSESFFWTCFGLVMYIWELMDVTERLALQMWKNNIDLPSFLWELLRGGIFTIIFFGVNMPPPFYRKYAPTSLKQLSTASNNAYHILLWSEPVHCSVLIEMSLPKFTNAWPIAHHIQGSHSRRQISICTPPLSIAII